MSNSIKGYVRTVAASLTMASTVLSLAGFAAFPVAAYAVAPADFGLREGDVIRATGDVDLYIVNDMGYKRLFVNPAIFNLYGHLGWSKVKEVAPSTRDAFVTSGLFRVDGDAKVYGLDVVSEDVANLRWVNTTGAQAVVDDANFFKKVFTINAAEKALYGMGADYTSVLQVPNYSRGTTVATGPLSASLAYSNPASSTLIETQSMADLAHFSVMGSGAVTKLVLKKLGVAGDSTLSNVYLFVNGERKSDGFTFASGELTLNNAAGFFTAPATVSIRGNIADTTAGQTIGVGLTMLNDSVVSVNGNIHTIATNPSDLGSVTVVAPTSAGDVNPQSDVKVWESDLTIGGNDMYLKRLSLRLLGSSSVADFRNFRLFVDGTQVATSAGFDANEYVHFLTNTKITTSAGAVVKVVADIVSGSTRTYQFQLKGAYDLEVMDADYSVNVTPGGTFPAAPSSGTIGGASVTSIKATNSPSGDVVDAADDVVWATYTLTTYGEAVKIDTLSFYASVSDSNVGSLRDGRVLINGVQYGSTQSLLETASTSFTVNYTLVPGSPATVEVRADAYDASSTEDLTSGDVVSVVMDFDSGNAEGVSSGNSVNVPGSDIEGNNRSIVTGSMTLTKNSGYANQTVVLPQTAFKVGEWNLVGPSTEAVNLNTFSLDVNEVVGSTFNESDLQDLYIVYGSQTTTIKGTVSADGQDNEFSVSKQLAASETLNIKAYATLKSGSVTANDSFKTDLSINGTTVSSGTSLNGNSTNSDIDGQTIAYGAGSLTLALDADSPVARIVADGQTVDAAKFKLTAVNDTYKPTRLIFGLTNTAGIDSATVTDGSTTVAMSIGAASASIDLNSAQQEAFKVTAGSTKVLTVKLAIGSIETPNGAGTGLSHAVTFDVSESKAMAASSGTESTFTSLSQTNKSGNALYAYAAIPTISRIALPSTVLANGTTTLAKWSVSSGGTGTIGWIKSIFTVTPSSGVSVSSLSVWDADSNTQITGGISSSSNVVTFLATNEQEISGAKNYYLKGTVAGTDGTSDSVVVTWNAGSTAYGASAASSSAATAGAGTASFVWTDQSLKSPHTESTADWNNDWLVKNLSLDSWTLQN